MKSPEDALVELIRLRFDAPEDGVGIGDDAAILHRREPVALTTDILIEGIDFFSDAEPQHVATKAFAANLSDLAAMGACPDSFLLTLAFPLERRSFVEKMIDALAELARRDRVTLLGGDLSRAQQLCVSITAVGTVPDAGALLRSGAKVGERIYVTQPLGGAEAGLRLLEQGWRLRGDLAEPPAESIKKVGYAQREFAAAALRKQLLPRAESAAAGGLAARGEVGACIDISDGLSTDLNRLCESSNCGAVIVWEKVPLFLDLVETGFAMGIDPDHAALHGGEEYALLFTSPLRESELCMIAGQPVYGIGRVTGGREVLLSKRDATQPFAPDGFDHFR